MTFTKLLLCSLMGIALVFPATSLAQEATKEVPASLPPKVAPAKDATTDVKKATTDVKKDDPVKKTTEVKKEEEKVTKEPEESSVIRVHLMDKSVMSGELSVKSITVDTDFGKLIIPVSRIRSLIPGLESHPEEQKKIGRLVQQLGSNNARERDAAQRTLLGFGTSIQPFLVKYRKDADTERRTRVQKILAELEEMADEELEEGIAAKKLQLITEDTVVTDRFTVVGNVTPKVFQLQTKFGPLIVALADIREAKREVNMVEDIRKKISVPGTNIIQVAAKSTGIRIKRGDKITFAASGKITMTPWGNNSVCTPDGSSNYQWYEQNKIAGGCLVGRIGNSGKVFKIGSKASITATSGGTLYLAIAVNHSYARGYSYPGQYDVKVRVSKK